jgi:hypothetical protein
MEPGVYEWQDVYISSWRKVPAGQQIHREGAKELLQTRREETQSFLSVVSDEEGE